MIIFKHVGTYTDPQQDYPGMIEVLTEPPKNLECPDYRKDQLEEDVLIIDSDDIADSQKWIGCRAHWTGIELIIEDVQLIENGKRALIALKQ